MTSQPENDPSRSDDAKSAELSIIRNWIARSAGTLKPRKAVESLACRNVKVEKLPLPRSTPVREAPRGDVVGIRAHRWAAYDNLGIEEEK